MVCIRIRKLFKLELAHNELAETISTVRRTHRMKLSQLTESQKRHVFETNRVTISRQCLAIKSSRNFEFDSR